MSIQDDYFELVELLKKRKDKAPLEMLERIWRWGCDNESENEKLSPIVNGMREAISLLFAKE